MFLNRNEKLSNKCFKCGLLLIFTLSLSACMHSAGYAPVIEYNWRNSQYNYSIPQSGWHKVKKGETLYAIAWRYGLDYRELAAMNSMGQPYALTVGSLLKISNQKLANTKMDRRAPTATLLKTPVLSSSKRQASNLAKPQPASLPSTSVKTWRWPVKGKIIGQYNVVTGNKGIDIAGVYGQPIYAAASGTVAYSGNGLRGYGNLLIIKHTNDFLSAYAHNSKLLFREGAHVKAGQTIAYMGKNRLNSHIMLHFEIRRKGKPVNPLLYLKK